MESVKFTEHFTQLIVFVTWFMIGLVLEPEVCQWFAG